MTWRSWRRRARESWRRWALVTAGVAIALAVFAMVYGWLPWWIDGARLHGLRRQEQLGALSSDRGDVLKMVAGAGALVALVYTARKHSLDRSGQVTDRYTKAIAQLASERESERIGAVYALERIMRDSAPDRATVVEVLAAFVRERAPLGGDAGRIYEWAEPRRNRRMRARALAAMSESAGRPAADVQAAMSVLARRPARDQPVRIDLRRTELAGLELDPYASLARANLHEADLTGVELPMAVLYRANLRGATLTNAFLYWATLTDAYLIGATLTGANFDHATLTGADLYRATLTGANFDRATLKDARGLEASQLADAILTDSTGLDDSLAQDAWVRARIEACKDWPGFGPAPERTPEPPTASH